MKRFAFRLERVRRLRETVKREAEAALARALAVVARHESRLAALRDARDRAGRDLNEMLSAGDAVDGAEIQSVAARIAALVEAEKRRVAAVEAAREEAREFERRCLEATRASKVMDKLREKKEKAWRIEFDREEQRSLDELHRSRSLTTTTNEETRLP